METRFFFADDTGDLSGVELYAADDSDPCEISFSDYAEVAGRRLPKQMMVRYAEAAFAEFVVEKWDIRTAAGMTPDGT
jgi:hypothetical protein